MLLPVVLTFFYFLFYLNPCSGLVFPFVSCSSVLCCILSLFRSSSFLNILQNFPVEFGKPFYDLVEWIRAHQGYHALTEVHRQKKGPSLPHIELSVSFFLPLQTLCRSLLTKFYALYLSLSLSLLPFLLFL